MDVSFAENHIVYNTTWRFITTYLCVCTSKDPFHEGETHTERLTAKVEAELGVLKLLGGGVLLGKLPWQKEGKERGRGEAGGSLGIKWARVQ